MALSIHPKILEWLENGEAPKLCRCGDKQVLRFFYRDVIGDYSMAGDGHWSPDTTDQVELDVECLTCMCAGAVVGTEILNLDDSMGPVSPVAFTPMTSESNESDDLTSEQRLAAAEVGKAIVDLCTNCPDPAEFYYTNENGIFGLCRKCKEAFELGQVNSNVRIKGPNEESTEAVLLSPDEVRDMLDFIAEAEDKGMDLKEVERVRAILGYPIW